MREILFRAKRLDNGEWVEGHLISYEDGRARIVGRKVEIFCYEKDDSIIQTVAYRVDPETVSQYTGMVDYESNKIWENDIIEEGCNGLVGKVVWKDELGTYGLKGFGEDYVIKDARIEWEVIGNIFDNPELVKGGVADETD